jgi:tellurite resistance protein
MKKVLFLGLILTLFAAAASAQQVAAPDLHRKSEMRSLHHRNLSRSELRRLHKDEVTYKMARRKAQADGIVTRAERRRLNKMKMRNRRELYHMNHDRHVI